MTAPSAAAPRHARPASPAEWARARIREDEIARYLDGGRDFIRDDELEAQLAAAQAAPPEPARVREILAKSRAVQTLAPDELAALIAVRDPELWDEMKRTAADIKRQVYDNRIVTFAPLYLGNACVNNCLYCGLRSENAGMHREVLTPEQIRREVEVLAGRIGHKRLIAVFGEHPQTDVHYMADCIREIYAVKVRARAGWGSIRRVNVNAAPLPIDELKILHEAGIGTFQVFQETYHHATYARVHSSGYKKHYPWRLTCMHRALEAGVDDVGIGALFGLYDWRFELMGLLTHARELERVMGIGPHTISFPRIEPAENAPYVRETRWAVSDADMEKLVTLIRLAVPYTGMILTARESADRRRRLLPLGVTQIDASSNVGIGGYSRETADGAQEGDRQQFYLGDTRSLDEVIGELARDGQIVSFCTAGYRCGRTGECIMDLLRSGAEGKFCKLNAILTYREWLDDFASERTRAAGEIVIAKELDEVRRTLPKVYAAVLQQYERTAAGERDLYF